MLQFAAELAAVADVSLASRTTVGFVPQRPLGHDIHSWYAVTGIDTVSVGPCFTQLPTTPVIDDGRYRTALNTGSPPDVRPH